MLIEVAAKPPFRVGQLTSDSHKKPDDLDIFPPQKLENHAHTGHLLCRRGRSS